MLGTCLFTAVNCESCVWLATASLTVSLPLLTRVVALGSFDSVHVAAVTVDLTIVIYSVYLFLQTAEMLPYGLLPNRILRQINFSCISNKD